MAKSNADSKKTTFGKRRKGEAKKSRGPKDKNVKPYKGQGK